jgi:hypothetical protein
LIIINALVFKARALVYVASLDYFIKNIPACRLPAGRQGRQVLSFKKKLIVYESRF